MSDQDNHNGIWFTLIGDYTFLRKTSFYIHNAAIMQFIISLGVHDYPRLRRVGAGEGAFERLTNLKDKEFHSSLGNILLSYGFVGLGLLFALFYVVF